jgi:alpha-tubulin suppressor-like RCC1 family protein
VWCWGENGLGQLGDGTTDSVEIPTQVVGPGGNGFLQDADEIDLGWNHSCVTKIDGTAWCWGDNGWGKLGDGTNADRHTPVQVDGLSGVVAVSVGQFHTCSLLNNGLVWCWGRNSYGQLGDGTTIDSYVPVQVTNLSDVVSVSASDGGSHSCAVKANGTTWCWGYNNYGQLGDGTTVDRHTPVAVTGISDVVSVSAGNTFACAVKGDGTVWCWGANYSGQLGDDTTNNSLVPVQVIGPQGIGFFTDIEQVSAAVNSSCALRSDGTAWCWGAWFYAPEEHFWPKQMRSQTGTQYFQEVEEVSAKGSHTTCAARADGTAWCWGYNNKGVLGDGTYTDSELPKEVVALGNNVESISVGGGFVCSVLNDGSAWCWGENSTGNLGDGTSTDRPSPVQVKGPGGVGYLTGVHSVEPGSQHTCAILDDTTVWCWGSNFNGELGNGNSTGRSETPVQVLGENGVGVMTDATKIIAGRYSSCAVKANLTVSCWGLNDYGQLGNGSMTSSATPVKVVGPGGVGILSGVVDIAGDLLHICAVKDTGTVWCWGYNQSGQLGDGTLLDSTVPVQVRGPGGGDWLYEVKAIAAGGTARSGVVAESGSTCAIKTDRTVWCWGCNMFGKLGDQTTINSSYPVQVLSSEADIPLFDVTSISVGDYHVCALRRYSGTLWCWGSNIIGNLGDGTVMDSLNPVQTVYEP